MLSSFTMNPWLFGHLTHSSVTPIFHQCFSLHHSTHSTAFNIGKTANLRNQYLSYRWDRPLPGPRMGSAHKYHFSGKNQLPLEQLIHLSAVAVGWKPGLYHMDHVRKIALNFEMLWSACKAMSSAWDTESMPQPKQSPAMRSTDLQVSWSGWGSLRGTPWDTLASYKKLIALRPHSWNTRPLAPSSPPPVTCASSAAVSLASWTFPRWGWAGSVGETMSVNAGCCSFHLLPSCYSGGNCKQKSHCPLYLKCIYMLLSIWLPIYYSKQFSLRAWKSCTKAWLNVGYIQLATAEWGARSCLMSLSLCHLSYASCAQSSQISLHPWLKKSLSEVFLHFLTSLTPLPVFSLNLSVISLELYFSHVSAALFQPFPLSLK